MGRAGKTWAGFGLTLPDDTTFLDEPDNQFLAPYAFGVKRRMGRGMYPALELSDSAAEYEILWKYAFGHEPPNVGRATTARASEALLHCGGGRIGRLLHCERRVAQAIVDHRARPIRLVLAEAMAVPEAPKHPAAHVVVGSAYAHLSAMWIADRLDCTIVIVRRDLESLLATWISQGWLSAGSGLEELDPQLTATFAAQAGIPLPPNSAPVVARTAWLFGFLTWHLRAMALQHPDWPVVDYETLVTNPQDAFQSLACRLGIDWTPQAMHALDDHRESIAARAEGLRPKLSARTFELLTNTIEPFDLRDWGLPRDASPAA
jgi:hypothetical protein